MRKINNIYLVGFMGTGKSAVGRELAQRLKRDFIDLDALIEEKEKKKIGDIFAKDGEPHFRKIEKDVLKETSLSPNLIVSCGGGIVLIEENIRAMKATGIIICLTASPDVIINRTKSAAHRPLLNVEDPRRRIEELLKLRAPFYAKADYTIDSSSLNVPKVADIIANEILPNVERG